jgi:hypothetical protein
MTEYYYSDGNAKHGPYTFEQIQAKRLTADTLVWHDNLPDWMRIAELPEFKGGVAHPKAPPPIPLEPAAPSAYIPKSPARPLTAETPSITTTARRYMWLIIWCSFHILAWLLSSREVKFFNSAGIPKTDKFWPFVKFTDAFFTKVSDGPPEVWQTQIKFNGLFAQYDWTEFSFYVGSAMFVVLLIYVYRKTS